MVLRAVQVKMKVCYEDMLKSLHVATERIKAINGKPDAKCNYTRDISFFEYVCQMAESICAEIVVARYLGYKDFEPTINTFKNEADVGSQFEVKWTKYANGAMIIYDNDRNSDIAILVTGKSPNYEIRGWLPVSIAKSKPWRRRDQPTFWVEQYNLHPIENLKRSSHGDAALPM